MLESTDVNGIPKTCSDFIPSFSNDGLCLTRNGHKIDDLFKHTNRMTTFNKTFLSATSNPMVERISKKQSEYHFTFIVDANRYNNFKKGRYWNVTSYEKIKIGIHSPQEVADIRGWYNKIVSVATGHITTIKVKPSQQQSEDSIKELPVSDRKCRFEDENTDLSSMKTYTNVHCLLDCKMKFAEKVCGCRPWDYPDAEYENFTQVNTRICDFFGSSCFDKILRQDSSPGCDEDCVPGCNKVSYSIDISEKAIDPEHRICNVHINTVTNMESIIKDYIFALLERNDDNVIGRTVNSFPELTMMNKLKDILMNGNNTGHQNESQSFDFEMDCRKKLKNDISVVVISIDSPTFSRTTKSSKGTALDKLAYVGKVYDDVS